MNNSINCSGFVDAYPGLNDEFDALGDTDTYACIENISKNVNVSSAASFNDREYVYDES